MSGGGRRGRRGGRRQRRREEQRRAAETAQPPKTNGQSGPGHPAPTTVLVAPAAPGNIAVTQPAPVADVVPHPRPMSARELVAKLEALRIEAEHAAHPHAHDAHAHDVPTTADAQAALVIDEHAPPHVPVIEEPRLFTAKGTDWLARSAGRGTGGTGRVAQARIEAIRFSTAAEPEHIAAEVIVPHVRLDDLYDDELAELLERGLRSRKTE